MSVNEKLVTITDRAAAKLREIMARENRELISLRIGLVRTHCMDGQGYTYRLALEDAPAGDDEVSQNNGIEVRVDPTSAKYLRGLKLDYLETMGEAGFKIDNPNIVGKCPCGHHDIFE